jgi:preprotein translocase subunit Sec63
MMDISEKDVLHALELLGLTLPTTKKDLERALRVQLYTWNPSRYANLTNNPKQYMKNYKQAEEMTKKIEAAYALLCAVLVPD